MKERGKFIVFEGVGGCGKGTQIARAYEMLKNNGLQAVSTREPGGVAASEEIRKLIFTLRGEKLIDAGEQMVMFFTARKFWVDGVVAPNLDAGIHVLADRGYTSTGAYQGYGEGGNIRRILAISDVVMKNYKPDAIILLDVSPETSMKRRTETNGDPFDKEGAEYFQRIVAGYREMARGGWGGLNWFMVNGEPKPEVVSESVAKILEDIFETKLQR